MSLKQIQPKTGNKQTPYGKTIEAQKIPYTRLYLVRHSDPEHDHYDKTGDPDLPLSKIGHKKSIMVANRLKKLSADKIYTSEFLRAKQTAEAFGKKVGIKPKTEPSLNEIDWADWYKVRYFNLSEQARRKSLRHFKNLDKSLDLLQARVRKTLYAIVQKNRGKRIAIFSHGNFIRAVVTGILDADIIGFLSLEIYQASITEIVVDKNNDAKINYVNATGHLPQTVIEDLFASSIK